MAPLPPDSDGETLTYAEAVLWIYPLLTAIDKVNGQLGAIREIEQQRASQ